MFVLRNFTLPFEAYAVAGVTTLGLALSCPRYFSWQVARIGQRQLRLPG